MLCVLLLILLSHLLLPLFSSFRSKNGGGQWRLFWGWGAAAERLAASLHECRRIRMVSPPQGSTPFADCCVSLLLLVVTPVFGVVLDAGPCCLMLLLLFFV